MNTIRTILLSTGALLSASLVTYGILSSVILLETAGLYYSIFGGLLWLYFIEELK